MARRLRASAPTTPAPSNGTPEIVQKPDPECWSLARLYADGDHRRLVVLDERTVLVRNQPA